MCESSAELAAEVLHVSVEDAIKNSKTVPEIDATYYWNPSRSGGAVIINAQGEKLAAGSSISFEQHIQAFKGGRRN